MLRCSLVAITLLASLVLGTSAYAICKNNADLLTTLDRGQGNGLSQREAAAVPFLLNNELTDFSFSPVASDQGNGVETVELTFAQIESRLRCEDESDETND